MFKKQPICEICSERHATVFVGFWSFSHTNMLRWKFVCTSCPDEPDEARSFSIDGFFSGPASTVDTLAHMHETGTMDWDSFMEMMRRFRSATNSFNSM